MPVEAAVLCRVVRDEAEALDAEIAEDLRADAVAAGVDRQTLRGVGVDGVQPLVLQRIGPDLVPEADAPTFMPPQVHDGTAALGGDGLEGLLELGAAVAPQRAEDVAGEALAVHTDQHTLGGG